MKTLFFVGKSFILITHCKISTYLLIFFSSLGCSSVIGQGSLWGMTSDGGDYLYGGVIFKFDLSTGSYEVRHSFDFYSGGWPQGSLMQYGDKFYGVTASGGTADAGVIFEFDPSCENSYTVLHHFDVTNGRYPTGHLIEYQGKLYGLTTDGGNAIGGFGGVLFEIDPAISGSFTVLHHFYVVTGAGPFGSLIESGGKLYGLAQYGGSLMQGVMFEFDLSTTTYSMIHNFNYSEGSNPIGNLLEFNGKFYGRAPSGGDFLSGVIFSYDPGTGAYVVLHDFNFTDGRTPFGSLIEVAGKLYGFTQVGGLMNFGTLYEIDPAVAGSHQVLHHFDGINGYHLYGSPTAHAGKIYGLTTSGGTHDKGVIFEYDLAGTGTYTVLKSFEGPDGAHPFFADMIIADQADSDCDGVGDVCDQCPGGDDSIDNNHDGLADCHHYPGHGNVPAEWLCSNNSKVIVCHNGEEICVSPNAANAHLAHGDYLGPCNAVACDQEGFPLPAIAGDINFDDHNQNNPINLTAFPNPADGQFDIHVNGAEGLQVQLHLVDIFGKIVWRESLAPSSSSLRVPIDEPNLLSGLYLINCYTDLGISTSRIIIHD